MPDDEVTSKGSADDESEELATRPAATAGQVSADDGDDASDSPSDQTTAPEELVEAEASGELDAGEDSPESTVGAHERPDVVVDSEQFADQVLALESSRDAKSNQDTRPPDDEHVTFRSITLAEAYVGRETDSLARSLAAIKGKNFNESSTGEAAAAGPDNKLYPTQFILASGAASNLTLRIHSEMGLPDKITRIYGSSHTFGPSVVTLVLTFVLADDEANRLDKALRDDVQSRMDTAGSHHVPKNVYLVKKELVYSIRKELIERCLAWLKQNFPGTLMADGGHGVPVCSLVSVTKGQPFQLQRQPDYMRLLDLNNKYPASRLGHPDFFYLTPLFSGTTDDEYIAAFNDTEVLSSESYPSLSVISEVFHYWFSRFMAVHAIFGVFRSFDSRMRDIRSDLVKLDFDHATDSEVIGLRNKLLGLSRDIAIVCGDVTDTVDYAFEFWSDYPQLNPVLPSQPTKSTADVKRQDLRSAVKTVQTREAGLRELTLITSQSISDANNTDLQQSVLVLTGKLGRMTFWLLIFTGAVVVFSVASVIIGAAQLSDSSSSGSPSPSVTPHASNSATRAPTATPKTSPRT